VRLGHRLAGQGQLDGRAEQLAGDRLAVTARGPVERAAVGQPPRAVVEEEVRRAGGAVGATSLLVGVDQVREGPAGAAGQPGTASGKAAQITVTPV
jgi:hypothetical protein